MTTYPPLQRIPLNTLAIAFGLAGLASVWTAASAALGFPDILPIALWLIAAAAWVWLLVAHALRGRRTVATLASQLRHPVQGPIAALVPIVGMLLSAALHRVWPIVGTILVVAFIAIAALFAAWLISTWLQGGLDIDSIHGGYFLPTVAGGFVAAIAAADVGLPSLALGAFAVGTFFWVAMSALIIARLMFRPPLPGPLVPTLAIFVAPPAVAGTAWSILFGLAGPVEDALAALTLLMLLVQIALIPLYRIQKFSLGYWSFTFPIAAVGTYAIGWFDLTRPWSWEAVILIALGVTALVVAVAGKSLQLLAAQRTTPTPAAPVAAPTTESIEVH
jgi:tellurite resistance protein